jgi:inosine-uridine nucleoside N-ribohydrolase
MMILYFSSKRLPFLLLVSAFSLFQCTSSENKEETEQLTEDTPAKLPVLFDTDANNELDDQHALAYLLLNGDHFAVKGITVNATPIESHIDEHYAEAERILTLCKLKGTIPLFKGADGNFEDIKEHIAEEQFDGYEAVNFIIEQVKAATDRPLILVPVGKLTNIALALLKEPSIAENVRIVWLGSNYPKPGEYNQDNDVPAMNYVLSTNVPFEMVTVRWAEDSGTAAVTVTQEEINTKMPGKGPRIDTPIEGRHGGSYHTFGDYSVSLFEHIDYYNDARERALFDQAAVAIVKNPDWASAKNIPCPVYQDGAWVEQPDNSRKIIVWEHFDKENIIADFYRTLEEPSFATTE